MTRNLTLALFFACGVWNNSRAADLHMLPTEIVLTGPRASQRLLVVSVVDGRVVSDLTDQVQFISSNPAVAAVNEAGTVRAVGDGDAQITANLGSQRITA
jgi:hypothetical protein